MLDLCRHQIALHGQRRPPRRRPAAPREHRRRSTASWSRCSTATACRSTFNGRPSEIADALPFADDHAPRAYDPASAERLRDALALIVPIFERFRAGFRGKASPVHFFWGAFDLAVTRFSGHAAPPHPGGVPGLPDRITREAYSHEVSSAGFWAGGVTAAEPIFYSYAYPEPLHFRDADIVPDAARFDADLGEYVLPYAAVRAAADPAATLMEFLEATYAVAADLGHWDRAALERDAGRAIAKGRGDRSPTPFRLVRVRSAYAAATNARSPSLGSAALAWAISTLNVSASCIAMSARTFRSRSMFASLSAWMNWP